MTEIEERPLPNQIEIMQTLDRLCLFFHRLAAEGDRRKRTNAARVLAEMWEAQPRRN